MSAWKRCLSTLLGTGCLTFGLLQLPPASAQTTSNIQGQATAPAPSNGQERPNILMLMTDDTG